MENPWLGIQLKTYEEHMSSECVCQLQTLMEITKHQLEDYMHERVSILGIAGGNGLENINPEKVKKVYCYDINKYYLETCKVRYTHLKDVLELICCDLNDGTIEMPQTDLILCNLIIEYIGVQPFVQLILKNILQVKIISCVIQKNNNNQFVSSSEFTRAFDPLMEIHHNILEEELINGFFKIGFRCIKEEKYSLPNSKEFIRLDFKKF